MARLPQLVDALIRLDGRGEDTWEVYVRELRRSGLLPETKRGRGAFIITADHAAKLLLAGLASRSQANARRIHDDFWNMPLISPQRAAPVPALQGAIEGENFGSALTHLITAGLDLQKQLNRLRLCLRVRLRSPIPQAILQVVSVDRPDDVEFSLEWLGRLKDVSLAPAGSDFGFMYEAAVTERTFAELAQVLSSKLVTQRPKRSTTSRVPVDA